MAGKVDPLRRLFLELSQKISLEEQRSLYLLVKDKQISNKALERLANANELFIQLMELGHIGNGNFILLKELLRNIDREPLARLVEEFEGKRQENQSASTQRGLNRGDGVGSEPGVKKRNDAEEIHIDTDDTDQKSHTMIRETVSKKSHHEKVQNTSREILQTELKQAMAVKATLEEICKELTQKLEISEHSLVSQRLLNTVETKKLQSELEQKEKLVKELQHKVQAPEDTGKEMLETELKQAKAVQATLEEICKELTQKLEISEDSLVSQHIGNIKEREKLLSEIEQKETFVKDLQNKFKACEDTGQKDLETRLKWINATKAILEKRYDELRQKLVSSEQSFLSQRVDITVEREKLQSELEQKEKLVKELQDKVEVLEQDKVTAFLKDNKTTVCTASEDTSQEILETELKQTNTVKATLEERRKELAQKLQNTEHSLVSQRLLNTVEREKLQSELEQKEKLVKELQHKVEAREDTGQKLLEIELRQAKAVFEETCKELTQQLAKTEHSMVSQRISYINERQKLQSELKQKEKLVKELQHKVEAPEDTGQKILEIELRQAKAVFEETCKELTMQLEKTEHSLVSQRISNINERQKLQSELKQKERLVKELQHKVEAHEGNIFEQQQAKVEKVFLEERCKELTDKLKISEQSFVDRKKLQSELEKKEKMVNELLHRFNAREDIGQEILETELKQAKVEKATLKERYFELGQKLQNSEQSLVNLRIENTMEREKLQSKLEQKEKLVKKLQDKVEELEQDTLTQFEQLKKATVCTASEDMGKEILENEQKQAKATLEKRCEELTQKLQSRQPSFVSQRVDITVEREKLQSELEQKEKLVMELQNKVEELEQDKPTEYEQDEKSTLSTASEALEESQSRFEIERSTLESQLKEIKEEKTALQERCKELRHKLESAEQSLVSQRTRNSFEGEKLQSELEEKLIKGLEDKVAELDHQFEGYADGKQATLSTASEDDAKKEALIKEVQDETGKSEGKDMSMLKQKTINKLLQDREDSYTATLMQQKDDIKDQRQLWLFAADEERRLYQLPSGFALEVPPCAVEEDTQLGVTCNNRKRPSLEDYEYYQSDVLDFLPHNIKFKKPVYLLRKHLNIQPYTRVQIILISEDGNKWEELKTVEDQNADSIKVVVTHFSMVIAISRPFQDIFRFDESGGLFESHRDKQVSLEIPKGAVEGQKKILFEVHECNYGADDEIIASNGESLDTSFASIIYINRRHTETVEFKKQVGLNIPLPPRIPGVSVDDTELCILKDAADNDDWQDITKDCSFIIKENVLKLKTKSISGYTVGRYIKDIVPRMCGQLSTITKFKKSGRQAVQIFLLQHQDTAEHLRCDLVEQTGLAIKDLLQKSDKYSSFTNHKCWSNIIMTPGDTIENTVIGDMDLKTVINKKKYYPYCDNHWDAVVAPKFGHEDNQITGQMLFSRSKEALAELVFTIPKEHRRGRGSSVLHTESTQDIIDLTICPFNILVDELNRKMDKEEQDRFKSLLLGKYVETRDSQNLNGVSEICQHLQRKGYIHENNVQLLIKVFRIMNYPKLRQLVEDYERKHINTTPRMTGDFQSSNSNITASDDTEQQVGGRSSAESLGATFKPEARLSMTEPLMEGGDESTSTSHLSDKTRYRRRKIFGITFKTKRKNRKSKT